MTGGVLLANATGSISNLISITGSGTIAATSSATLTIGGNITGDAPTVGASGYTGTVVFGNSLLSSAFNATSLKPLIVSYGTLKFTGSNNLYQQGGTGTNPYIQVDNGGTMDMAGTSNNYGVATITLNNGTLTNSTSDSTGPATTVKIVLGSLGGVISTASTTTLTVNGEISGTGSLTIGSAGKTGTVLLSGANTYSSGATTISAGTLKLGAAGVITDSSALTITGTLDLNGYSETVGSIAGAGTITSSSSGTLTLTAGSNNSSTTFSGIIQNGSATSVALTKQGTGTLTLSGANTYSGGTTISNGVVKAGIAPVGSITSGAFGTGSVTVSSGGAIDLNTYTVPNLLSLSGTGYSSSGALYNSHASTGATASGNITLAADTTIKNSGSGTLVLSGTINGAQALTITNTGSVTLNGIVGGTSLNSLSISGPSTLGADVTTSGTQTYSGAVTVTGTGTRTLTGTTVTNSSTLNGEIGRAHV